MSVTTLTKPRNRRQEIWNCLRGNKDRFLTLSEIAEACQLSGNTVYGYLKSLNKGGFVSVQKEAGIGSPCRYRLERDTGMDAPRLSDDGQPLKCPVTEALWRTMRILKTFDLDGLTAHVNMTHPVSRSMVRVYAQHLEKAGYLKNTGNARKKSFVLLKNTGSKAPQLLAVREVYDPNINEIVLREVPDYE
ncbi:MAG: HTH domain-containing protein [Neisseria sp.]|nr:MAG: HTH domain-containing protein [Neisseria sp.]